MLDVVEPISQERYEKARVSAETLVEESVSARAMVRVRAIGQRLINLSDAVVAHELKHGWEDVDEQAVLSVLKLSAHQSATQKPVSIAELQHDVTEIVLPVLYALALEETAPEADDQTQSEN